MFIRLRTALPAIVFSMIVLLSSGGCNLSARFISAADPPEVVLSGFTAALRSKDFKSADQYLADGASVIPLHKTYDDFFDCYIDISVSYLKCEPLDPAVVTGSTAFIQRVSVTGTDKSNFIPWVQDNLPRIEHDYMLREKLTEFDARDKEAVSEMLTMAMNEYRASAGLQSTVVCVQFVLCDRQWKLVADEALIEAIFGGV